MQKDLLGQDVFLIGPPGPLRRSVAMQYLELTKREVEYIALSRDTTETDLKQRREIRAGTRRSGPSLPPLLHCEPGDLGNQTSLL